MVQLPSIPYPPPHGQGFWSPVTSTLNWCEEDYYATPYIAEIVNTFTNLTFLYLAHRGIRSCLKHGHDTVFLVAFCTYAIIGLGSMCFHTSLKYEMQLLDELSMIYTTCTMLYAVFSFGRSPAVQGLIMATAASLAVGITAYYHYLKDPLFHQNAFAIITSVVVFTSIYRMERLLRPGSSSRVHAQAHAKGRKPLPAELQRRDDRDAEILRDMWVLVGFGLGSVAIGFTIWNLDNAFCSQLRRWRREIGLPWGILLEGHGWWHIFTGLAAYYNLTWGVWLRYCHKHQQDDVEVIWPSFYTSVPEVVKKKAKSPRRNKSE